jgi:hypothetical protein
MRAFEFVNKSKFEISESESEKTDNPEFSKRSVSSTDYEKNKDIPDRFKLSKFDSDEEDDKQGRIVTRNRQIAYMKPISTRGTDNPDDDINVSVGLGKPYMRGLHGGGQSAVLTVGGNPGNRRNFTGVQLSQPLKKDSFGRTQSPGISAVFRKQF